MCAKDKNDVKIIFFTKKFGTPHEFACHQIWPNYSASMLFETIETIETPTLVRMRMFQLLKQIETN